MAVIAVTDATFEEEVLAAELPVLIDLYADWCGPCKQVAPVVEEISREIEGKVKVVKVDVDRNREIAEAFHVQSIPMLVIMAEGRVSKVLSGAQSKQQILQALEPVLPRDQGELLPRELAQLIQTRRVALVDARDASSFARVRIPGAISVPASELGTRAAELRRVGKPIVVYGRTGADSRSTAESLRAIGLDAAYLKGGLLEWEGDGLEVERPATS